MTAIYNEIDPFAVRWLRGLIAAGHIAQGVVDERSITELAAVDCAGPGQRHFFAGIAGWSLALRLAGVPDDADVWTGSCPCQPFSDAGRGAGFDDARHLWPVWFRLIAECGPAVVLGEQVASAAGLAWLDVVRADMEGAGYAFGAADLCAAGVGAPHIRQRLFFVAYANGEQRKRCRVSRRGYSQPTNSREAFVLADTRQNEWRSARSGGSECQDQTERREGAIHDQSRRSDNPLVELADTDSTGSQRRRVSGHGVDERPAWSHGVAHDHWQPCDWIPCSDGVSRPIEPGTHPLAHGVSGRVGLLRGYGNAFVPELGATFIRAALEAA